MSTGASSFAAGVMVLGHTLEKCSLLWNQAM